MSKRTLQEINAGSMADIAFLLLIFFLVTTTMDSDNGILRRLPPLADVTSPIVNERNILTVLVNSDNQLMVEDAYMDISELRETAKEFIQNKSGKTNLPDTELRYFPLIGNRIVTPNHVISLSSHRGTSFSAFISVQNELVAAYNELKDELAYEKFGEAYKDLKGKYQVAINEVYKVKISEAEPVRMAVN